MTDAKTMQRVRWAQILLVVDAVVWLTIGAFSLARLAERGSDYSITLLVVAVLMFGNVAALLLSAWLIGRQRLVYVYFALAVLAVNILLSVTDEFGIYDLLTMLLDIVIVWLLVDVLRRRRKH